MEQDKVEIEQLMSLEELVIYLEDLTSSLRNGKLVVETGEEYATFDPEGSFEVKVKAKHKENKGKFSLKFSWMEETAEGEELSISSEEPEEVEK